MGTEAFCPRCGATVRPPDLLRSEWTCGECGPVPPLHVRASLTSEILAAVRGWFASVEDRTVSLWCPSPLPVGWALSGVAWAGDERTGLRAAAAALSGPAPLASGPADLVFVSEELGVGLGNGLAGAPGLDPGPALGECMASSAPHAKVKIDGHPAPLWAVKSRDDRSAYVGEARGVWLYAITWPAAAGYLLAEDIHLRDLADAPSVAPVLGAPTRRLRPGDLPG